MLKVLLWLEIYVVILDIKYYHILILLNSLYDDP